MMTTPKSPADRRAALAEPRGIYERMVEIRKVEDRILQLYNDGHVRGSTHLSNGQEAVSVGVAATTRTTDVVTCTYRGHATALALGLTPEAVIGEITGRSVGCTGGLGGSMHLGDIGVGLFPTFAIVGAGLPVAAGAALTAQTRGTDDAAVAIFGDGAANIGAFHESLNLASIWKLPVVFVCENNLYGEYSRINLTTPVADLAERASSYGLPGVVVDGQDPDAVREAVSTALEHARSGDGPSLLEMKTYRYSGHSRSDPGTYRPAGELDEWLVRDPIQLYGDRLVSDSILTAADLVEVDSLVQERLNETVQHVLTSPEPSRDELLRHVVAG